MEVTNRFKGLDLIDRMPDDLLMEAYDIVQEAGIKTLKEKVMQNDKMVVLGGITNNWDNESNT